MDFLIDQVHPAAQRDHILVRQADWFSLAQFEQSFQMIQGVRLPRLCNQPVIRFQAERNIAPDPHRLDEGPVVAKAE